MSNAAGRSSPEFVSRDFQSLVDVRALGRQHALSLVSLGDDHTLLLDHSDLYDKPLETLRACADFLGLVPDYTCLDSFASQFILPAYRRVERSVQDECPVVDPWAGFARRIYESLVTRPTPRLLSLTEARTIAAAQIDLIAQLPMLLPVRQSIVRVLSALATEMKARKDQVDLLRGIIRPLSGMVQWLPSDERLFG